jgi:nicotinate-nucleotide pyrophosphorylase (carboxylating)
MPSADRRERDLNTTAFTVADARCARALIELALAEDLGDRGDVTSNALISREARGQGVFVARSAGVLCGVEVVRLIAERFALELVSAPPPAWRDGVQVQPGQRLGAVRGSMRSVLAFERPALNFLQRLSGIASLTARFVATIEGTNAHIYDTRKTTPGWRALEKYAVRCGGGHNHRMGLYDAVLIKDNHVACLADTGDPIGRAITAARAAVAPDTTVEVEVTSLAQLDRALQCAPDIVLLDNMTLDEMAEAAERRSQRAPAILLEASGGVTLESVRAIAQTGVDRISVGALTHSAPALDMAVNVLGEPA